MLRLPPEIIRKIYGEIGDDRTTLALHVTVCRRLSRLIRPWFFSKQLRFRNKGHLIEFIPLMAAPMGTFPNPVVCSNVCFQDAEALVAAAEYQVLSTLIRVRSSFTFPLPHARALSSTVQMLGAWSIRPVRQLILVGEDHTPAMFFQFVSSFPQLESLVLRRFSLKEDVGDRPERLDAFPQTLTRLSLDQSPCMLAILQSHLVADDSNVRHLHIRSAFSKDQRGILDMMEVIEQGLKRVETLALDALYDQNDNHIDIDMANIFQPKSFMHVSGLKHLYLNLTKVPPKVAIDFVGMCAVYRRRHDVEVIEVHTSAPSNSWLDCSPSHRPGITFLGGELHDPTDLALRRRRAKLVVHGFTSPLPLPIQEWGGSAAWGPRKTLLTFGSSDWQQVEERFGT